jgi:hypothetical protein
MNKTCTVYGLYSTESPLNIRYIGQTRTKLKDRLYCHIRNRNSPPVKQWIDKHIADGFEIKIVALCIGTWNDTEIDCVQQAKMKGWNILNLNEGGSGMRGMKMTDEWRRKQSEAHKGRIKTEEERKKLSIALTGKHPSEEARRKMSEAKKGKPSSVKGKKFSAQACENIRKSKLGNKNRLGGKKYLETLGAAHDYE